MRRQSSAGGRPSKNSRTKVMRVPEGFSGQVEALMRKRECTREEAWLLVQEKIDELLDGDNGSVRRGRGDEDNEDEDEEDGSDYEDDGEEDDDDDNGENVSDEDAARLAESIPSVSEVLSGGEDVDAPQVLKRLKREIARLRRGKRASLEDVLHPTAVAYCMVMTGLTPETITNLWERYAVHFQDETFVVTPTSIQKKARRVTVGDGSEGSSASVSETALRRQGRRPQLLPKDRFYLTLRGLRTGETQVQLGERFGIAQQTVSDYFRRGVRVLVKYLVNDFLVVPEREVLLNRMHVDWRVAFGEKVVLIADGTHFQLDVPEDQLMSWATFSYYKGFNSQQSLLVVDSSQLIIGITGFFGGRAHELSHIWPSCNLNRVFQGLGSVILLADKAYTTMNQENGVEVWTPPKSKVQFTLQEKNVIRVMAKYRVRVEHIIGKLKGWQGLHVRERMAFQSAGDGKEGFALVGVRDDCLFLSAALWNAKLLGGVRLQNDLGSGIFLAPRPQLHAPDAEGLPESLRQQLNAIPKIDWAWLLPVFDIQAGASKSNILAKAWRSVVGGYVAGVRFGECRRNSIFISVGAVVLPSMKQGCHYCYVIFGGDSIVGSFCTCKNGFSQSFNVNDVQADSISRCRHCISLCIVVGLAQNGLLDEVEGASKWFEKKIMKKREGLQIRYIVTSQCRWPPRIECLSLGIEDAFSWAKEMQGLIALHPQTYAGGWEAMSEALRARRERMDLQKQTLASLPFYAMTNGPKREELLQQVRDCGIVPPARATKEVLAWLIVQHRAQRDPKYASEITRLTCSTCSVCYFDDVSQLTWVCCSERGCFRWNHVECEQAIAAAVKSAKRYRCNSCSRRANQPQAAVAAENDVFFDGDGAGPPSVSLDEALSGHHVTDCIRANRHVQLGNPVFPDDDEMAL